MDEEKEIKIQDSRELLMKNMSAEERVRFLRGMEVGDRIMKEDYEVLKRLSDS